MVLPHFPHGTSIEEWLALDSSFNTATCSFAVTVIDTEPPTIGNPCKVLGIKLLSQYIYIYIYIYMGGRGDVYCIPSVLC